MSDRLRVLGDSVEHLRDVASKIDPSDYTSRAYPSEWSIADTFSHLGSGAVIGQRRFEDSLAQRESDPAFNTSVWDEWNAKDPSAQVADSLASDASLLSTLEASTDEQRSDFRTSMGPFEFDFDGIVGLRLGEHVLHAWDIEVTSNPAATLSDEAANAILDSIQFIVARTGKPIGESRNVYVQTSEPTRNFTLVLDVDSVELIEAAHAEVPNLILPAEAFVRLVYGRLDSNHTPSTIGGDVVDDLRRVFPGF